MALADCGSRTHLCRPDSLLLRVVLWACLLALLGGNVLAIYVKRADALGRWIILAALLIGLLTTLAYEIPLLLRRLQMSLAAWLGLAMAYAATMSVVSQAVVWMNEDPAGCIASSSRLSLNLVLLGLAVAALVLRGSILALLAAERLPEACSRVWIVRRRKTVMLRHEFFAPRLPLLGLCWLSPLMWWLLLLLSAHCRIFGNTSNWKLALLLALQFAALLRLALSAWVNASVFREWQQARENNDPLTRRRMRWRLFGSGLPAAGLLAFYAFCLAATRVQQDAVAAQLPAEEARLVAELRALQPPRVSPRRDAAQAYQRAADSLPAYSDYSVFDDHWDSPGAVMLRRDSRETLAQARAAAALDRWEVLPDYGVTPEAYRRSQPRLWAHRETVSLLVLEARLAALEGNFELAVSNVDTALGLVRQLRQQPYLVSSQVAGAEEEVALMGLVPALLWTPEFAPSDACLARALAVLGDAEGHRGLGLRHALQVEALQELRRFDRQCAKQSTTWPGNVELPSLAEDQPLFQQAARRIYRSFMADLAASYGDLAAGAELDRRFRRYRGAMDRAGLALIGPRIYDAERLVVCEYRLARAALGAARYKIKYQRWPVQLEACAPEFLAEIPRDVFNPDTGVRFADDPPRVYSSGEGGRYEPESHRGFVWHVDNFTQPLWGDRNRVLYISRSPIADQCIPGGVLVMAETLQALHDPDPSLRQAALRALDGGPGASVTVPHLVPLLQAPDAGTRMWAAYVLGRIGMTAREAIPALESLKTCPDRNVRHFAQQALTRIGATISEGERPGLSVSALSPAR